jgi:hypothetical protein
MHLTTDSAAVDCEVRVEPLRSTKLRGCPLKVIGLFDHRASVSVLSARKELIVAWAFCQPYAYVQDTSLLNHDKLIGLRRYKATRSKMLLPVSSFRVLLCQLPVFKDNSSAVENEQVHIDERFLSVVRTMQQMQR